MRLQAGRWRLQCETLKDSELNLMLESPLEYMRVRHDAEFVLDASTVACVDWLKRGREKYITVIAEKVA